MPTIADVAKRANVAVSTVSYAINGTRPISEETRQRIFKAMEELGYRPNALARGLASKRSRIIALLFAAPERGLGITEMEFVASAADAAKENGYHLVLWPSEMRDPEELRRLTQQGLVDGVVVMEVHLDDNHVNMLREISFPFTIIGRCEDNTDISYVDIHFEQTIQEAVRYLADLGHKKIAFLNHSRAEFDAGSGPTVRVHKRFEEVIKNAELCGVTRFCSATPLDGWKIFNDLLVEQPDLTALVAMNDRTIPGIIQAITERGWHIPEDFSLMSVVSSARAAEMMMPPLTTMDPPTAEMGRIGVELLIQQLEGQTQTPSQILLPCTLVVRDSSGPNLRDFEKVSQFS